MAARVSSPTQEQAGDALTFETELEDLLREAAQCREALQYKADEAAVRPAPALKSVPVKTMAAFVIVIA